MTQTQIGLFYLAIAIVTEVIATSALKASAQFTRLWPSVIVAMGYATSFYLLSRVLKVIPVGVTYAIWSGMGIVLISLVGAILYGEIPDAPAVIGMTLIVIGVVVINVWSGTLSR
jgi:small multidrug resistance pump